MRPIVEPVIHPATELALMYVEGVGSLEDFEWKTSVWRSDDRALQ